MVQLHGKKLHVLLIGIDGYPPPLRSLGGCVNDVEAFEMLLIERFQPAELEIRKLIAPASEPIEQKKHQDSRDKCLATRAAILAELRRLDTDLVQQGERVLIYYAGHGSLDLIESWGAYHEGIVPWDRIQSGLIYDFELNLLFQSIAERCKELTVILDCCHAAGATRHQEQRPLRYLPPRTVPSPPTGSLLPDASTPLSARIGVSRAGPIEYTVLVACHADQSAAELQLPDQHQKSHGLFSHCLLSILRSESVERLQTLRFMDIWEPLKAAIKRYGKCQDPWLLGPATRRLFGGPWVKMDAGLPVQRASDGSYQVGGGTLVGIGRGSRLAIYGEEPPHLPIPETPQDLQVRLGVLEVESADLASCIAHPPPGQAAFQTPPGARARRIGAPSHERLCVGLHQSLPTWVAPELESHGAASLFRFVDPEEESAEVLVHPGVGAGWYLRDDDSSLLGEFLPSPDSALARVPLAHDAKMIAALHAALVHLAQYVVPIRLCRQSVADATEVPGLQILTCRALEGHQLRELNSNPRLRHEAGRGPAGRYLLEQGEPVCILLTNRGQRDLFVTLILCSMEGQLQVIETNTFIPSCSVHLFWAGSVCGAPFLFGCPRGRSRGVDRIIVVATEKRGVDLHVLDQERTLQQTIVDAMASRNVSWASTPAAAPPFCVAAQTLVEISAGA